MNIELKKQVFSFLEELRDSGKINMFGSVPYLQKEFGFSREEGTNWFKAWMESFNE